MGYSLGREKGHECPVDSDGTLNQSRRQKSMKDLLFALRQDAFATFIALAFEAEIS